MRSAAIFLALLCSCLPAEAARAQSDDWFGRDKALHAGISAGVGGGAYAAASAFTPSRPLRLALGAGSGVLAGAGKEMFDLAGGGDPSLRDFTWDLIGTLTGTGLAWLIDLLVCAGEPAPSR